MAKYIAPSPLKNKIGATVHDGGCTFRIRAFFASAISVEIWNGTVTQIIPLAKDSSMGCGNDVWSVFARGVTEDSVYRYIFYYAGKKTERRPRILSQ